MTQSAPVVEVAAAIGRELQQRREAAGLSIETLALRLKVSSAQLELLESGAWDRLPGPVFVRGTVRLLARELDEDPNEWLQRMSAWTPTMPQRLAPPSNAAGEMPSLHRRQGWRWFLAIAVLVAIALGYVQWFWPETDWMEQENVSAGLLLPSEPKEEASIASSALPLEAVTTPSSMEKKPSPTDGATPPVATAGETQKHAAPPVAMAGETQKHAAPLSDAPPKSSAPWSEGRPAAITESTFPPQSSVPVAPTEPAPVMVAPSQEAMTSQGLHVLAARGESWMRITDAQGKVVYEGILRQGNERRFSENGAPYALHLGNAQALEVRWNGALVETGKGVTRLTVPAPARARTAADPAPRSAASPEKPAEP